MSEPRVKLLVLTTCMQCKALKKLLDSNDIEYESTDVDLMFKDERDELFRQMAEFNEKKAFPVTFVNGKAIIGFQRRLIMEELGLADER